jgi:hypothetical protein
MQTCIGVSAIKQGIGRGIFYSGSLLFCGVHLVCGLGSTVLLLGLLVYC